jgi:hypothetical protein
MAFIPLKNFLSIRHFKLIGLIGSRAVGERVKSKMTQFSISLKKTCPGPQLAGGNCSPSSTPIGEIGSVYPSPVHFCNRPL